MSIGRSSRSRGLGNGFRSNVEHAEGFFVDGCVAGREAAKNGSHIRGGLFEDAGLAYRDPGGRFGRVAIDAGGEGRDGGALGAGAGGEGEGGAVAGRPTS